MSAEERTARRCFQLLGPLLDAKLRSRSKKLFVVFDQEGQAKQVVRESYGLP